VVCAPRWVITPTSDPDVLIARKGRKAVSDKAALAEFRGLRLVTTSEIDKGQSLAEGSAKELTESHIRAEHKYGRPFTFANEMTFMFSANHKLVVEGGDDGIWRRIRLIEWSEQLPEAERDSLYFEKYLQPELDGILSWCVQGARDYAARGADPPHQVLAWTATYREQSDPVARWLEEECASDPAEVTRADALWASFETFVRNEKAIKVSRSEWKERLADAGFAEDRPRLPDGSRARMYAGLKLNHPPI
jgi:P4 family phage/plasmid primase-like protien